MCDATRRRRANGLHLVVEAPTVSRAPRLVARVETVAGIVPLDAYFDVLLVLAERAERAAKLEVAA